MPLSHCSNWDLPRQIAYSELQYLSWKFLPNPKCKYHLRKFALSHRMNRSEILLEVAEKLYPWAFDMLPKLSADKSGARVLCRIPAALWTRWDQARHLSRNQVLSHQRINCAGCCGTAEPRTRVHTVAPRLPAWWPWTSYFHPLSSVAELCLTWLLKKS